MSWMFEPRPSRYWYDDDEGVPEPTSLSDVLGGMAFAVLLLMLTPILFVAVVIGSIYADFVKPAAAAKPDAPRRSMLRYLVSGVVIALLIVWWVLTSPASHHASSPSPISAATSTSTTKATVAPRKTRLVPTPVIPAALLPTQVPGPPPQDWLELTSPAGVAAGIERCAGKLLYQWASPDADATKGSRAEPQASAESSQASQPILAPCPDMSRDWMYGTQSFGAHMPEPPTIGIGANLTCGGRATFIHSPSIEKVETARGVFEALRVDAEQGYEQYGIWHHYRGWIKHIADLHRASEWWVCGLGLVRVSASYEYDDGVCTPVKTHSEVSLLP